jgi:hypothetical protein
MGVNYNTSVVSNGLIMVLDAQNPKSYQYAENLLPYSTQLYQTSAYPQTGVTLANNIIAPDGTNTATLLMEDNSVNNAHWIAPGITGSIANTFYTASCYYKPYSNDRNFFFQVFDASIGGNGYTTIVTSNNGTSLQSSSAAGDYGYANGSFSIVPSSNGWFRVAMTWKTSSYTSISMRIGMYNTGAQYYNGNGTSGIYVWGPQIEKNSLVGPYTPTVSSSIVSSQYWNNAAGNTTFNLTKATIINAVTTYGSSSANVVSYNSNIANTISYWDFSDILNYNITTEGGQYTNSFGFVPSVCPIPTTGSFTLTAFIKRSPSTYSLRENVFGNGGGADGWRFGYYANSGQPYYLIGGVGGTGYQEGGLGTISVSDGKWHQLTILYDRAAQLGSYTVYGYVDGVLSGSVTITAGASGNVAFTPNIPGIGVAGCCSPFMGALAYLAAYNRALTQNEVIQNFNALRGRFGI